MNFCVMYISSVRYTSFLGTEHSVQLPMNVCVKHFKSVTCHMFYLNRYSYHQNLLKNLMERKIL